MGGVYSWSVGDIFDPGALIYFRAYYPIQIASHVALYIIPNGEKQEKKKTITVENTFEAFKILIVIPDGCHGKKKKISIIRYLQI